MSSPSKTCDFPVRYVAVYQWVNDWHWTLFDSSRVARLLIHQQDKFGSNMAGKSSLARGLYNLLLCHSYREAKAFLKWDGVFEWGRLFSMGPLPWLGTFCRSAQRVFQDWWWDLADLVCWTLIGNFPMRYVRNRKVIDREILNHRALSRQSIAMTILPWNILKYSIPTSKSQT